jgi:hypothetical protein
MGYSIRGLTEIRDVILGSGEKSSVWRVLGMDVKKGSVNLFANI